MDNFFIQLQSIKSQIANIQLQINNIEMQYNNMNNLNQGDQLINLGIQMLNTGLISINIGKTRTMSSLNDYFAQLKNVSEQINNIININVNMNQQMPIFQQQQFIQGQWGQMMNQFNYNNFQEKFDVKKMNITFQINTGNNINLICDYGTKIKDVLELFSKKIGKPKNNYYFLYDGYKLNYNDERKIENVFPNIVVIKAIEL